MEDNASPLMQRRRLRDGTPDSSFSSNLTQEQVAKAMEWSLSKMNRIEKAKTVISINDLRALLPLYGITAKERADELLDLARTVARARSGRYDQWWRRYNENRAGPGSSNCSTTNPRCPRYANSRRYSRRVSCRPRNTHRPSCRFSTTTTPRPSAWPPSSSLRTKRRELLTSAGAPEVSFSCLTSPSSALSRQPGHHARAIAASRQHGDTCRTCPIRIVPFGAGLHRGNEAAIRGRPIRGRAR